MKVVGVIPARWGSTRFPGKSLFPIAGKPLIQWVIEAARKASRLDELLVATDDERIQRFVATLNLRAVLTRSDHPSGTDRAAEAVRNLQADVVVNIQGDEPVIEDGLIDRLATTVGPGQPWEMATAAVPIGDADELANPSVVKVVWAGNGRALYFSRSAIPYVREADKAKTNEPIHWRHIGIYAYPAAFLETFVRTPPTPLEQLEKLEQLRALHIGARIAVLRTRQRTFGVDTPADVVAAEHALRTLHGV